MILILQVRKWRHKKLSNLLKSHKLENGNQNLNAEPILCSGSYDSIMYGVTCLGGVFLNMPVPGPQSRVSEFKSLGWGSW